MKKFYFLTLAAVFVLFFALTAHAAAVPTVNGVKGLTKNSLSLQVQDTDLTKQKAYIQVYVDEINEGEIYTLKYYKKLSGSGKYYANIKGLDQGTTYRFKVRMRAHTEDAWSDYSDYYYATTRGNPIW